MIGELRIAAQRQPQLFGQMALWLDAEYAAGYVGHDSRSDAGEYVRGVVDGLGRASIDAETLTAALDSAHDGSRWPDGGVVMRLVLVNTKGGVGKTTAAA